jgi:hypothetical protein
MRLQPNTEHNGSRRKVNDITWLFGLLVIVGPLHMIEQMLFGIDELYEMKRLVAMYHSWFSNKDVGTVVLVTIAGASVLLMMYGLIRGGRWRLAVVGLVGLLSAGEAHHVVRVVLSGHYNPGVITCVPFATIGVFLVYASYVQFRSGLSAETQSIAA